MASPTKNLDIRRSVWRSVGSEKIAARGVGGGEKAVNYLQSGTGIGIYAIVFIALISQLRERSAGDETLWVFPRRRYGHKKEYTRNPS
jgi:hypothetical protein